VTFVTAMAGEGFSVVRLFSITRWPNYHRLCKPPRRNRDPYTICDKWSQSSWSVALLDLIGRTLMPPCYVTSQHNLQLKVMDQTNCNSLLDLHTKRFP
jgi:hypothetical protein